MSMYEIARKAFKGRFISPYQPHGIKWMLGRETSPQYPGGMLCDEMGLGKTAQTVATMLGNPLPRTLIIVPKSVMTQWEDEIKRFAPSLSVSCHYTHTESIPETRVVICAYGITFNRKKLEAYTPLHRVSWDRVILDEGHEIRNASSKTHKSICALRGRIHWVLSGTPIYNSMKDFVGLCGFLGMDKRDVQAATDSVRKKYILRRTKEDVCMHNKRLELPPCDFANVELEMYPEEKMIYDKAFTEARDAINEIFATTTNLAANNMRILECLLRVRQCMAHPQLYLDGIAIKTETDVTLYEGRSKKFDTLIGSIKEHPNEKSLIFCQFITEMDMIQQTLMDSGHTVYRIDGSVSGTGRDERLRNFKSHDGGCVFIIQVKSGGVGLNLQEATRVYITSPSWNPATELQAIGRSHRTGQTSKVVVRKFIYDGDDELPSVEQSMMALQGAKSTICAEVLNDPRLQTKIPQGNKAGIGIRQVKNIFSTKKIN